MIENPVRRRLGGGLPVVGHWISLPSPAVAELMASFEPDWLMIDTEHGPAGGEVVEDLIRAMKGRRPTRSDCGKGSRHGGLRASEVTERLPPRRPA